MKKIFTNFWFRLVGLFKWTFLFVPNPGDQFLVTEDFEVNVVTHWQEEPHKKTFNYVVPKGTILFIYCEHYGFDKFIPCHLENDKEFIEKYIPEAVETPSKYAGYSLMISYSQIGKTIKHIEKDEEVLFHWIEHKIKEEDVRFSQGEPITITERYISFSFGRILWRDVDYVSFETYRGCQCMIIYDNEPSASTVFIPNNISKFELMKFFESKGIKCGDEEFEND